MQSGINKEMNKLYYLKSYRPRFYRDYARQGLCIITLDKIIYSQSLKYFKCNYKNVSITKQGRHYIIKGSI
jgi:hypothetical protein